MIVPIHIRVKFSKYGLTIPYCNRILQSIRLVDTIIQ
nr:MAG TPA: hypothetical protein [Bacteriophage sp.]